MMKRVFGSAVATAALLVGARAQQQESVPADHTCVVTIADPLSWVEAALRSEAVGRALRCGALGDLLSYSGVEHPDPRRWLTQLQLFRAQVPTGVTLAFPPETSGAAGAGLRCIVVAFLLAACEVAEAEPGEIERARAELIETARTAFPQIAAIRFAASVRCRDERTAAQWFEMVAEAFDAAAAETPTFRVQHFDAAVRLAFVPGTELAREDAEAILAEVGLDAPELTEAAFQLLARMSVRVDVSLHGAELRARLHPTGLAEPDALPAGAATPLPPVLEGQPVLSYRMDLRALQAEFEQSQRLWERFEPTPVGRKAAELDEAGFLDDLPRLLRRAKTFAFGSGAVSWDDTAIRFAMLDPATPAVPIANDPLWRLVPANAAFASVDGTTSVHDMLHEALLQLEDGLARAMLMASWRDDKQAEELDGQFSEHLRRALRLRRTLAERGPEVLTAPHLTLVANTTWSTAGEAMDAPRCCVAVAGRLRTPGSGLEFARELFASTAEALALDATEPAADGSLGLGTPTVVLPLGVAAERLGITVHAFEWEGNLVLSTSVQLSRSMLAGKPPPRGTGGADAVVRYLANGARAATWCELASALMGATVGDDEKEADEIARLRLTLSAISEVLAVCGEVEMTGTVRDGVLERRGAVRFRSADRGRELASLLERAREAIGPWPVGGDTLVAAGTTEQFVDGRFEFRCRQDGDLHNRITGSLLEEENVIAKSPPWHRDRSGCSRSIGSEERDLLIAWNAIWSGRWIDAPRGMQLALATDTLPGSSPEVLVTFPSSSTALRLVIDADTSLLATYRCGASVVVGDVVTLTDYRAVHGRTLPHRAKGWARNNFTVSEWRSAEFDDVAAVRPLRPDDSTFTDEPSPALRYGQGVPELQVLLGDHPCWLAFDIVEPHPEIARPVLARMGIEPDVDGWARVPELRVGPLRIRELFVRAVDAPEADAGEARVGRIGVAVMRRACVELDLAKGKPSLRLHRPGALDDRGLAFVPVEHFWSVPTVRLRLEPSLTVRCALGTNALATVSLVASPFLDEYRMPRKAARLRSPWSGRYGVWFARSDLVLAEQPLRDAYMSVPMQRQSLAALPSPAAVSGWSLAADRFVIVFDLANDKVALVPR
jgi:hypothetical protein